MENVVLTAKRIQFLKPSTKRYEVPAGDGLYLLVRTSGTKSWCFRYRYRGRTRNVSFKEPWPVMSLALARAEAARMMEELKNNRDPAKMHEEEIEEQKPDTVKAVGEEWITRYVKPNTRTATAVEWERILRKEIIEPWKDKYVAEIGKPDILRLLDSIVDRGAPVSANRIFEVIRAWLNWCVQRGYLESSPAIGIKAPAEEEERERVLTVSELTEIWTVSKSFDYPLKPFLQLATLLPMRRSEIATMRWSNLDLDKALWTIPAKTMGRKSRDLVVPLPTVAVELLKVQPRYTQGDFVLTTTAGAKAIKGFSKMKSSIDKAMLKSRMERGIDKNIEHWILHDLRRTTTTMLAERGVLPHILSAILGHSAAVSVSTMPSAVITKVYNRYAYLPEKRQALEDWAQYLSSLKLDETAPAGAATA